MANLVPIILEMRIINTVETKTYVCETVVGGGGCPFSTDGWTSVELTNYVNSNWGPTKCTYSYKKMFVRYFELDFCTDT